jgi:hypothetical protein
MFSVGGQSTSGVEMGIALAVAPEPSSLVMLVGIVLTALLYWGRKLV